MSQRSFPWIAAVIVILDQASKWWIQQTLPLHASQPVLPGLLKLSHVHNTGSAFSLFRGASVWLAIVSVIALAAILRYWISLRHRDEPASSILLWGLALPFGGAAGNLIDRLRFGYVVDFLELPNFPVFNIADSAITIGAMLLVLHFMRQDTAPRTADRTMDRLETSLPAAESRVEEPRAASDGQIA